MPLDPTAEALRLLERSAAEHERRGESVLAVRQREAALLLALDDGPMRRGRPGR